MAEVERVADRVGLLDEGRLVQELSMSELRHQATSEISFSFADPVSAELFERVDGVGAVAVDGNDVVVTIDGAVADVLKRAGELGAIRVATKQRDLDEIFLDLFERAEQ
jgi:ABC-type multidrug transport system ATPase subunit